MYVYVYVCLCVWARVCLCLCMYVGTDINTYMHIHTHSYFAVNQCLKSSYRPMVLVSISLISYAYNIHIFVCLFAQTCAYTHTHIKREKRDLSQRSLTGQVLGIQCRGKILKCAPKHTNHNSLVYIICYMLHNNFI